MEKRSNIFDLLQNDVVGAIALHGFAYGFNNVAKNKSELDKKFPYLNYFFYVLPIVYNEEAMSTFKSSNELYTVLIKNNSIVLELQGRANKMAANTFKGLNMAFGKKILILNKDEKTIELGHGFQSKKLPLPLSMSSPSNTVKRIQDCAYKLGAIFAKRDAANIQLELNIRL